MSTTTYIPITYIIDSDCGENWEIGQRHWFQWRWHHSGSDETICRVSYPSSLPEALNLIQLSHRHNLPVRILCRSGNSPIPSALFRGEIEGIDYRKVAILNLDTWPQNEIFGELCEPDQAILSFWSSLCHEKNVSDHTIDLPNSDIRASYIEALHKWIQRLIPLEKKNYLPQRPFHHTEFEVTSVNADRNHCRFIHRQFTLAAFSLVHRDSGWCAMKEGAFCTLPELILNETRRLSTGTPDPQAQEFWRAWVESFDEMMNQSKTEIGLGTIVKTIKIYAGSLAKLFYTQTRDAIGSQMRKGDGFQPGNYEFGKPQPILDKPGGWKWRVSESNDRLLSDIYLFINNQEIPVILERKNTQSGPVIWLKWTGDMDLRNISTFNVELEEDQDENEKKLLRIQLKGGNYL